LGLSDQAELREAEPHDLASNVSGVVIEKERNLRRHLELGEVDDKAAAFVPVHEVPAIDEHEHARLAHRLVPRKRS
jgi:hypothetical protein